MGQKEASPAHAGKMGAPQRHLGLAANLGLHAALHGINWLNCPKPHRRQWKLSLGGGVSQPHPGHSPPTPCIHPHPTHSRPPPPPRVHTQASVRLLLKKKEIPYGSLTLVPEHNRNFQ